MSWVTQTLSSSLGRKVVMSLTGLFLCSFLIVHAGGNLQLFASDGGRAFNEYSHFMTHNPIISTIAYLLYGSIILHAVMALILTRHNREARPTKYAYSKPEANSLWSSRNMGILGTVMLVFIIVHMRHFWYETHFGALKPIDYGNGEVKDLYTEVAEAFKNGWYVIGYVVSMVAVGYHLVHGFQSGFQTLGIRHKKYTPLIKAVGVYGFGVLIPVLFAIMPIYMFLKGNGFI